MSTSMKSLISGAVLLALGAAAGWGVSQWRGSAEHGVISTTPAAGAASAAERKVLYWYDPMVPSQKFDKPGKSPFMDMQLVPRYADEGEADQAGTLKVSTQAQQSLGLRLATVGKKAVGAALEATGTVGLNERDVSIVQSRAMGFVERVYARAPGDVIAAGAPLVDVLLPEWLAAQQEYLAVKATGDAALTAAIRSRLVLLGMPATLIERVEHSGTPVAVQTITAPTGGLITELMVRGGMTVGPGMTLARINGLATVWLEAAVPEALAATILPGQVAEARFPALPGQVIKGRVSAVLPEANRETRTLRVRIELPNPRQQLKAGVFAQVSLRGPQRDELVLPADAVIRTGRRALVYLAEPGGRYRPLEVQVGEQINDVLVVRSGLAAGQQVVASGQFLLDSEASLQGVLARSAGTEARAVEHVVRGVVMEVDAGTITLDHEAVPALKWPKMTMPFKLATPQLAQQAKALKKGQAVEFAFTQQGDESTVVRLAPAGAAASGAAR